MKKSNMMLSAKVAASALTAGLILTATVGSAWSYFTTNTSAEGGYAIVLDNETQITERFSAGTKHLVVTNDGQEPVYVRARAYSVYELDYSDAEGQWVDGEDGYYYYSEALDGVREVDGQQVKDQTSELLIKITFPEKEASKDGDSFNVVVIYESTPVQYDTDGNALDPRKVDWSAKIAKDNAEGGVE